jgi:hypothetical protein
MYPAAPSPCPRPRPLAERGEYSQVSFAIEPIQPPILPLSLLCPQSLRTTAAHTRGADRSANGCTAQSGVQILEVRELAELRRQLAVQVIPPYIPASAHGTARHPAASTSRVPDGATPFTAPLCPPRGLEYAYRCPSRHRPLRLASSPTAVPATTPKHCPQHPLSFWMYPAAPLPCPRRPRWRRAAVTGR